MKRKIGGVMIVVLDARMYLAEGMKEVESYLEREGPQSLHEICLALRLEAREAARFLVCLEALKKVSADSNKILTAKWAIREF